MGTYQEDVEAHCLANTYNLTPPRSVGPAKRRPQENGKYEPDRREGEEQRNMVLANWQDKTNILILYNPDELDLE